MLTRLVCATASRLCLDPSACFCCPIAELVFAPPHGHTHGGSWSSGGGGKAMRRSPQNQGRQARPSNSALGAILHGSECPVIPLRERLTGGYAMPPTATARGNVVPHVCAVCRRVFARVRVGVMVSGCCVHVNSNFSVHELWSTFGRYDRNGIGSLNSTQVDRSCTSHACQQNMQHAHVVRACVRARAQTHPARAALSQMQISLRMTHMFRCGTLSAA